MKKLNRRKCTNRAYSFAVIGAMMLGAMPAFLNFVVDPYEMFRAANLPKETREFAEKTHYPLWKFAHYDPSSSTVILGDSRARSLKEKYWKELGATKVSNMAYGGGTIPEIYSTFQEIKSSPNLKTLIVGVQLRSFDERHKSGMNRVPEAIATTQNSIAYLKNWFVSKVAWQLSRLKYPEVFQFVDNLFSSFLPEATAEPILKFPGKADLDTLLEPEICSSCQASQGSSLYLYSKGPNLGLGRGRNVLINLASLPSKFQRQVEKNARSDWKGFRFSERYMRMIEEIGEWGKQQADRRVIFIVPPTIVQMQKTILQYGLEGQNKTFLKRLTEFGTVVDFDFPNEITQDFGNFSDAYHFNAKIARAIVGEVLLLEDRNRYLARVMDKRERLRCPDISTDNAKRKNYVIFEESTCRILKGNGDV